LDPLLISSKDIAFHEKKEIVYLCLPDQSKEITNSWPATTKATKTLQQYDTD